MSIYSELRLAGIRLNATGQIHCDDIDKAEPILLKYINASPMLVPDTEFNFDDPTSNRKLFNNLEKRKKEIIKSFGDYVLYQYPTYIALIHLPSKSVSYVVRFEHKKFFGKRGITQVILWREAGNTFAANLKINGVKLTAFVFFEILLEKADCIVTDGMQTTMGKRFWQDRIGDALAHKLPVYYINQFSKKIIQITKSNRKEVEDTYKIWAEDESAKNRKIAICKEEIFESTSIL